MRYTLLILLILIPVMLFGQLVGNTIWMHSTVIPNAPPHGVKYFTTGSAGNYNLYRIDSLGHIVKIDSNVAIVPDSVWKSFISDTTKKNAAHNHDTLYLGIHGKADSSVQADSFKNQSSILAGKQDAGNYGTPYDSATQSHHAVVADSAGKADTARIAGSTSTLTGFDKDNPTFATVNTDTVTSLIPETNLYLASAWGSSILLAEEGIFFSGNVTLAIDSIYAPDATIDTLKSDTASITKAYIGELITDKFFTKDSVVIGRWTEQVPHPIVWRFAASSRSTLDIPGSTSRNWTMPDASGTLSLDTHNHDASYLGLSATAESSKAGYWATNLRGLSSTIARLNYLSSATGTTGTTSTNLVYSGTPTLTTPEIGAATGTSLALSGSSGNTLALETSGLVYDATNNRVGIGTASPSYPLQLSVGTTTSHGFNLTGTLSPSTGVSEGIYCDPIFSPSAGGTSHYTFGLETYSNTTYDVAAIAGVYIANRFRGSQGVTGGLYGIAATGYYGTVSTNFTTIANVYGGYFRGINQWSGTPTGTITNSFGVYIANSAKNSNITLTNARGLAIETQTVGTNLTNLLIGTGTTGNWSIYNNSTYDNFFAGKFATVNNITNEGLVAVQPDTVSRTTASTINATNFTNCATAGLYEIGGYVECTTGSAGVTATVTLGWTDAVGATSSTPINLFAMTTTGRTSFAPVPIKLASGNITWTYTISGANTVSNLYLYARRIY